MSLLAICVNVLKLAFEKDKFSKFVVVAYFLV